MGTRGHDASHLSFPIEDEGAWSLALEYYCICMRLCVLVCVNFGDEILLRREECKT